MLTIEGSWPNIYFRANRDWSKRLKFIIWPFKDALIKIWIKLIEWRLSTVLSWFLKLYNSLLEADWADWGLRFWIKAAFEDCELK
jgi:hypothetical protein